MRFCKKKRKRFCYRYFKERVKSKFLNFRLIFLKEEEEKGWLSWLVYFLFYFLKKMIN